MGNKGGKNNQIAPFKLLIKE